MNKRADPESLLWSSQDAPVQSFTVDVVVPVYNGARYLSAALGSIFAQTLLPAKVIVVDDGSTDGSAELVAACEFADRITLMTRANGGQSAARNAGVACSTASLVAFLDQDDVWYPNHLSLLVKKFQRSASIGWVYSDFDEIDDDGLLVTRRFHRAHSLRHPRESLAELLSQDMMVLPTATVVRADAFRAVGGFDENLSGYEDDDLFIRMFRAHWLPAYVSDSSVKFRVHGSSSSKSFRFGESRLLFLDKLQAELPVYQRLNRYYIRDLVVPRLLNATVHEYSTCIVNSELAEAAVLAELATKISARAKRNTRRQVRLWLMRRPKWYRRVLVAQMLLPSAIRRRVLLGHRPL